MTKHIHSACRALHIVSVIAVFALISAVLTAPSVFAQTGSPLLNPKPFEAEDLGLTINLPADTSVVAQKVNNQIILSINDDPATPTWTMQVQTLVPTVPDTTAATQIDELLREFRSANKPFQLLSNVPFMAGRHHGQLCYITRTEDPNRPYVSGWLLLPNSESSYLVFMIQTLPDHLPRVRTLLEASFQTIQLQTPEAVASERQRRFSAGEKFLASATPQLLKKVVGQSQWHRIYRPATAAGAESQEIGFSFIEVKEAMRGSVNEGRSPSSYSADEREQGILVRVQARIVIDPKSKDFYDSIALYWMAWDQSSETWSVLATRRQGEAERSESETGIREAQSTASPRPLLRVIKRTEGTEPVSYEWEVPPNYLSQPLGWLVGRLLPQMSLQANEMTFYYFVSSNLNPKVYQRTDTWTLGPNDQWLLTTQLTSDSPSFQATYTKQGALVRRVHSDGTITEPIELSQLQKMWSARGLQIGN